MSHSLPGASNLNPSESDRSSSQLDPDVAAIRALDWEDLARCVNDKLTRITDRLEETDGSMCRMAEDMERSQRDFMEDVDRQFKTLDDLLLRNGYVGGDTSDGHAPPEEAAVASPGPTTTMPATI